MNSIKRLSGLLLVLCLICSLAVPVYAAKGKVKVNLSNKTLNVLETKKKTLKVKVDNAPDKVKWSTSKASVAKVSSKGVVTGVKKGTATITATSTVDKKKKATCKVKVSKYSPVKKVSISQTKATVCTGESVELKYSVSPNSASETDLDFSSSNRNVAIVSSKGVVTGIGSGTTTITGMSTDGTKKKDTCKVTVKRPITVGISNTYLELNKGDTSTLTATVENGSKSKIRWSTSDSKVATVSSKGVVKGVGNGTVVITVQSTEDKTKQASCTVVVHAPSLDLSSEVKDMEIGSTTTVTATLQHSNDNVVWSNSSSVIEMTINGNACMITAKRAGIAKITVSAGAVRKVCTVTVREVDLSLTGSDVEYSHDTGYKVKVHVGDYADVRLQFSNNVVSSVKWISQNVKVASLYDTSAPANSIRGLASGITTATVKMEDGTTLKFTIQVLNANVTDILLPTKTIYAAGDTDYVYVHYKPIMANIVSYTVETSNPNVANAVHTGDGQFKLTTIHPGEAILTFRIVDDNGNILMKSMNVTVN